MPSAQTFRLHVRGTLRAAHYDWGRDNVLYVLDPANGLALSSLSSKSFREFGVRSTTYRTSWGRAPDSCTIHARRRECS